MIGLSDKDVGFARRFAASVVMAILYLRFAAVNYDAFVATGRSVYFLAMFAEAVLVAMYLVRSEASDLSRRPGDWALAFLGTCLPLFTRPFGPVTSLLGGLVVYELGLILQALSFLSLNRSFGIVPANRGVKTSGMYRLVRHPIYLAHTVVLAGYCLVSTSTLNILVTLATVALLVGRTYTEERLLSRDPSYVEYRGRVRWRLVPFVY